MEKKKVYVSEVIAESAMKRLKEKYEIVSDFNHPEQLDAILTRKIKITKEIIYKAEKCKVIVNHGAGTDQIDLEACKEKGIPVESTPGLNSRSVAEMALGFILALSYKLKFNNEGLKNGDFKSFGLSSLQGSEIYGKKLGLVGSGNVARILADIMKNSFGCKIFCFNPGRSREELAALGFEKTETVEELFSFCDFVSIHCPLKKETLNLINKTVFEKANPDLILVNTSRGGIINEKDLYEALVSKRIKACGLDVFETEPPSDKNPLLSLPDFIGTFHSAGSTKEALERVGNRCVDNIERYLEK